MLGGAWRCPWDFCEASWGERFGPHGYQRRCKGFDAVARTCGLGLISMEGRLRILGAELRITSRLGEGTEIGAQLRLPEDLQTPFVNPNLSADVVEAVLCKLQPTPS
jgi:hypothetical protein